MYLTHLDEGGNDSPAILIENATAANRAVNIPEFVNIPSGGLLKIDSPATEFSRIFDLALSFGRKKEYEAAVLEWRKALELSPQDAKIVHYNLAVALAETGRTEEAITHLEKTVELDPEHALAYTNLGVAQVKTGQLDAAIANLQEAVALDPRDAKAHANLGGALAEKGRIEESIAHCQARIFSDFPDCFSIFRGTP